MYTCVSVFPNKSGKKLISYVNAKTQEIPTLIFCLDELSPPGKNEGTEPRGFKFIRTTH